MRPLAAHIEAGVASTQLPVDTSRSSSLPQAGGGGGGEGPPSACVLINHEAVPERSGDFADPFRDVTLFKRNPVAGAMEAGRAPAAGAAVWRRRTQALLGKASVFNCYENGKAIGRIGAAAAVPSGGHRWRGQPAAIAACAVVDPRAACLCHYANCGERAWTRKYATLGMFPDAWFGLLPITLPFHLRARDAVQRALAGGTGDGGRGEAARALYEGAVVLADVKEVARQLGPGGACIRVGVVSEVLTLSERVRVPVPGILCIVQFIRYRYT